MRLARAHNSTTEAGRHAAGANLNVRVGKGPAHKAATHGQSPTTGAGHDFNGLHPERVRELKNAGEEQAEDQVSEQASPFNGSLAALDAPEEADADDLATTPYDNPPSGRQHDEEPHQGRIPPKRLGAANGPGNYTPAEDAESGAMNRHAKRGKSSFYGD